MFEERCRWLAYHFMWRCLLDVLRERVLSDWFNRQEEIKNEAKTTD